MTAEGLALHRRQFVLGPEPFHEIPGWVHEHLPGLGHLAHCPELPVQKLVDADGVAWRLLGSAWSATPPAEELSRTPSTEVPRVYRRWAGRWLLLGDGRVHPDAAALLGCFYRDGWVSSSAALLARDERPALPLLRYRHGLDWYPLPLARFRSMRRLLPSQVLEGGRVAPRPLVVDPAPREYDRILDELEAHLVGVVRAAAKEGTLRVPLTAGYDSRLVLAATRAAGVAAGTYTQGYQGMSRADRELPPELARVVGCSHAFVEGGEEDVERTRLHDAHTAGHVSDRDREFFARGQWSWPRSTDVILRGGCFEVGRGGFDKELGEGPFTAEFIRRTFPEQMPEARDALVEWIAWCRAHEEPLDWRTRFYWEQRLGGWLSAIEQSLDLTLAAHGHVANAHRFYELVVALSEATKLRSIHHVDLIRRMCPELLRLPFNPQDPLPVRLRNKALATWRAWVTSRRAARTGGTA